jgi:hypothetical protein
VTGGQTVVPLARLVDRLGTTGPPPRLIAVDGRAGAGKSTLADRLAAAFGGAAVLRVDGFLCWGDLDGWWPRFEAEALRPLAAGEPARFRVRDWRGDPLGRALDGWRTVRPGEVVVVEGVTCSRRPVADRYALRLWVETPAEVCLRRGLARDGAAMLGRWRDWQRREEAFFAADPVRSRAQVEVCGDPRVPHDPAAEVVLAVR